MKVETNVPLKNYTSMQIGGPARFVAEVSSRDELIHIVHAAKKENLPLLTLGGGSNVIVNDSGYDGLVIINRIPGFEVVGEDDSSVTLKVGSGENWDDVVKKSVDMRLSGIEALSAIPGTAGATPIQNVGAYGQEIADTLIDVEAYDIEHDKFVTLSNEDCGFSYRSSIFKTSAKGKYIIISITLKLSKASLSPPFYQSLQSYIDEHNITFYTPDVIRDAVITIRESKLPNPKVYPNSGSFFKNPIVEEWLLNDIKTNHPDIPSHSMPDKRYKIPAAWLIEQVGLKGRESHNMKVHDKNALVLINNGSASYEDLRVFRDEIITAVRDEFRIELEQEPEEILT